MVDQRRFDNQRWIDAGQASRRLGVSRRTLYAYVSRGHVRSVAGPQGRARLYDGEDIARLKVRRDARAGHGAVAAGALRWGEPVLDSAITAITPHGPAYRGHLAIDLAANRTSFEAVAELLWSGILPTATPLWPRATLAIGPLHRCLPPTVPPVAAMQWIAQYAGASASGHAGDHARSLVCLLAAALSPDLAPAGFTRALSAPRIATIAARALGVDDDCVPIIDTALIVLADHELNASSFAARVAASTGADLHACVLAALATLSGPRHGTASEAVSAFADEVGNPAHVRSALRGLMREGRTPPGFGHPLYPFGDPRAAPLIAFARDSSVRRARTLVALVDHASHLMPSVDVGLAAVTAALGLAPSAASGLFALARSAGWLAHILEQRTANFVLRPRARYVGPAISSAVIADSPDRW